MQIKTEILTQGSFKLYGDVIDHDSCSKSEEVVANQGTAKRKNWQSELINLRNDAKPNICTFRVNPSELTIDEPLFTVRLLERHSYSTQAFIPMDNDTGYLVIVCLNGTGQSL
jgi:allantoicase